MDYLTQYYKNRAEQLQQELEQLTEAVLAKGDGTYYEQEPGYAGIEGLPRTWQTVQGLIRRISPSAWDDWIRSLPDAERRLVLTYMQSAIQRIAGQSYLIVYRQGGQRNLLVWNPNTGLWEMIMGGTVGKWNIIDGVISSTATASGFPTQANTPQLAKIDLATSMDNGTSAARTNIV